MFPNREQAGILLGEEVRRALNSVPHYDASQTLVVGLPRGGVPVARQVAAALKAPLTILVSKKIGAPMQSEFAIGAVTSSGYIVLNQEVWDEIEGLEKYIESERQRLMGSTRALEKHWLEAAGIKDGARFEGKRVILVDDGVATGMTALAAIRSLKATGAGEVILATPVISVSARRRFEQECEQVISVETPDSFIAIAQFYGDFNQVEDAEVIKALKDHAGRAGVGSGVRA